MNLLTATEVADILRLSTARVYVLVRQREIPSVRIGERQVRFDEGALQGFFAVCQKLLHTLSLLLHCESKTCEHPIVLSRSNGWGCYWRRRSESNR